MKIRLVLDIKTLVVSWKHCFWKRCFQNRNLRYTFQTLFAQKPGLAHPYFLYENESLQHCLSHYIAESALEPPSGFEHGTPGLGIQRLNHQAIAPWDMGQMTTLLFLEVRFFQRVRFLGCPFFLRSRARVRVRFLDEA